ncbi:hypothetical protein N7509_011464 [Penicillium cosmopolitanum]|uniref:Xylanolytic transcriptional activator regulatory domain-containing protein n=1 Tax=Penicillium cosmopolitanum TaxID=1131564 RepID=A0A9X0B5I8_9EURO|nr:uncharacterized protein N7509_011464 [Penicillium cosmopolitanum]KAJ5388923.1 hypothetical protein N7509_011464 [Penicillium cosmopolitanum]
MPRLLNTDDYLEIIKCRFSNGSYDELLSYFSDLTSTTILLLGVICTKRTTLSSSVQPAKAPSLSSYTTLYLSWVDLINICRRNRESFSASQEPVGDFCNRRSIKCRQNEDPLGRCQNCADFDVPCTFDRPAKRRGVKAGSLVSSRDTQYASISGDHGIPAPAATASGERASGSSISRSSYRPSISGDPWSTFGHGWSTAESDDGDVTLHNSWKAFAITCDRQIKNLVQVYFETVYPIFPLFHMPSFIEQINSKEHLRNQGLFASTMAVCSLASGRARDGALYSNRWHREDLIDPPSEVFFAAARDSIPRDLLAAKGIHYMRACAILALASIQNGQIKNMQKYSGLYHTLTSMDGLYDEKLWPKVLSPIETEERRRLFWSIYTLDIYSTVVRRIYHNSRLWRADFITENEFAFPGNMTIVYRPPVAWLRGWNFTTDLYRILEYVVDGNRRRFSSANGTTQMWSLFDPLSISEPAVMDRVMTMYSALPSQFHETPPITGDMSKDLFGFQSANIQATLQLLRMVLLSAEEVGVERKCDVAGEVLQVFSNVPIEYLKAISSPLLHHLGGIGYILGSVIDGSLSEASYTRVRTLLLKIADLLQHLETGSQSASDAGERLRTQVDRIDGYMRTSLLLDISSPSNAMPVINGISEAAVPSVYAQNASAAGTTPSAGVDQMSQFQLPPELLTDWPWPLDSYNTEGFLPFAFD